MVTRTARVVGVPNIGPEDGALPDLPKEERVFGGWPPGGRNPGSLCRGNSKLDVAPRRPEKNGFFRLVSAPPVSGPGFTEVSSVLCVYNWKAQGMLIAPAQMRYD